jgi:hypothetical protein
MLEGHFSMRRTLILYSEDYRKCSYVVMSQLPASKEVNMKLEKRSLLEAID